MDFSFIDGLMEEVYSEAGCPSIDPVILINWTTFDKNCERCFKDTDLFERVFYRMLKIAAKKKLIRAERVFVDSTDVKASANKHKFEKNSSQRNDRACICRCLLSLR